MRRARTTLGRAEATLPAWWLAGVVVAAMAMATTPVCAAPPSVDRFEEARERMVRDDIAGGGVKDPRVIESMRLVPRHEFVGVPQRPYAYFDMALPIGAAQTISGPFVVAYMTEKLEPQPTDRVLEIGTGSGYQAAVLSPLVGTVYSIEISRMLGEKAARTLARLGYRNVITKIGDGFQGWAEHAPFDKIIVTCSPENIPQPLVDQLAEGGRMIIPVGERYEQTLVLLSKRNGVMERESLVPSLFVPMTGVAEQGRKVQPNGTKPALHNGGFEEMLPDSDVPAAWYYGRQFEIVAGQEAPEGRQFLRLENVQPGRPAQLFQGFPVDGRDVGRVTISLQIRAATIGAGPGPEDFPGIVVRFFNDERSRSSNGQVGPWKDNGPWRRVEGTVTVPLWAREAILQVGLLGGTGTIDVDDVRVSGIPR